MSLQIGVHQLGAHFVGSATFAEPAILRSVSSQLVPRFIYEEYPQFIEFMETFMDFVELKYDIHTSEFQPGPYFVLKKLVETVDIDRTLEEYLTHFKRALARDFPKETVQDIRIFLKNIRDFYNRKGTADSFDFFFRSLFASFSEIYLPKVDMFRASDGRWLVENQIRLRRIDGDLSYLTDEEYEILFDAAVFGETSKTSAWLGAPTSSIIIGGGPTTYTWMPVLSRKGEFAPGEYVTAVLTDGRTKRYWINLTDAIQTQPGRWLTTDSFISSEKRLQDSFYWQDFSYVVRTDAPITVFVNPLINSLHPAGLKIFAEIRAEDSTVVEVYPENFLFLFYRYLIIWVRNWDLITGVTEIPEIDGMDADPLSARFSSVSEGQAFFDWGHAVTMKESDDMIHLSSNIGQIAQSPLSTYTVGLPINYIFASFAGRKVICSDTDFNSSNTTWSKMRVTMAEQCTMSIVDTGLNIEELSTVSLSSLDRFSIQVLPYSELELQHHVITDIETSSLIVTAGDFPVSILSPPSKVLIFVDGVKVRNIFTAVVPTFIGGVPRAHIHFMNPLIGTGKKAVVEVLVLNEKSLSGTVGFTLIENLTTQNQNNFVLTTYNPSYLARNPEPWNFLVFKNGNHLKPAIDYSISDDATTLRLDPPGLGPGEYLEVYSLNQTGRSYSTFQTLVNLSKDLIYPKPAGSLFDYARGRLRADIVTGLIGWFNFDMDPTPGTLAFLDIMTPTLMIVPTGTTGQFNGFWEQGSQNNTGFYRFGDGTNEGYKAESALAATLQADRTSDTQPMCVTMTYNAGVDAIDGKLFNGYSDEGVVTEIQIIAGTLGTQHKLALYVAGLDDTVNETLTSLDIENDVYNTVTAVYDGVNINIYVNGVLHDSAAFADGIDEWNGSDPICVGSDITGAFPCTNLKLDSFGIYFGSSIEVLEAKALYNGGTGWSYPERYF